MRPVLLPTAPEVPGSAEALAVRFGPLPFSAMRRVRRVLTDTPRSRRAIAQACGSSTERVSGILSKLVKAGLALKLDAGYVRGGPAMAVLDDDVVPMEIGRRILLCLTEPRRAKDIACIIGRPASNTTGQLRHLLRRGLVVRLSKGIYDLARADGHPAGIAGPARPPRVKAGSLPPGQMPAPVGVGRTIRGV